MTSKSYTGINIQFPISQLILSGEKSIETRTYPLPKKYIGQEMAIIETPGKGGRFKSRVVGIIVFGESFRYPSSKKFYEDQTRHRVSRDSDWAWNPDKGKWGWPILKVSLLERPLEIDGKAGIVYRSGITI